MNKNHLWWQTGVVYQIYPRSYADTTANGMGDLPGITSKLDYLSDTLGVDAIWLSPFYPSPMKDFGYDVADYCDVDPRFGTLADFDKLLVESHKRGMQIIIDWVPNHSSDQHKWFIESRSSRDNPKRDWYVWRDPKFDDYGKRLPPNNWQSLFGGIAWEWDEATKQYYLHSFVKEQPDLNWRNPELKAAMFETLRFWLERGVDGFRVDVAHFIMKDPALRDNPPTKVEGEAFHRSHGRAYDSQIHIHDHGHPDLHPIYQEMRKMLDEYSQTSPRVSVGEIHVFDFKKLAEFYGTPEDGLEFHLPFNFSLLKMPWQAQAFRNEVDAYEAALPAWATPTYVLGNHDEGRIATRYGEMQSRVAAMLLLTLRGTPTVYYGEELGMTDVIVPPEKRLDPYGLSVPENGRDRCRTPMQWDTTQNAGFSEADPDELWLPVAENAAEKNVATELDDPQSHLALYRELLKIRKASNALRFGAYRSLNSGSPDVYLYERKTADETMLIALNFSDQAQPLPETRGKVLLSTHLDQTVPGKLRPHEGLLIQTA